MKILKAALLLTCILIISLPLTGQEKVTPGIAELYRLDRLPIFKESIKVATVSSYDRTGGNNDGFDGEFSYVGKEKDGLVIADLEGPGVIYRIWTPTPSDDIMEFYFDGEKDPRIKVNFRKLFLGDHPGFKAPLVGFGAGGFYSYVPIPYKKSCKILVRAENFQFYQINYASYSKKMGIESYPVNPDQEYMTHYDQARELFGSAGKDISKYANPGGSNIMKMEMAVTLQAGQSTTLLEADQPGRIIGFKLKPATALGGKARDIILKAYWDDDPEPAVNCPVGDFFGYAWGEPAMQSLLIGTNERNENYCYYPMPFNSSGRIELYAEEVLKNPVNLQVEILYSKVGLRKDEGKFYTVWNRENPTVKGKPFTFIDTKGRGHIVGVTQQSQGLETGNTYYFEGDDQTTIDGELVINGTGSEDFYNGGWYDVPGRWETRVSRPLSGCLDYKKHLGRTGGYRIMLGDAYAYKESILQTIEHAPENNELINDYVGVTYLYSANRPTCNFALPPLKERKVSDPTRIIFATWWNVPIYSSSLDNAVVEKRTSGIKDKSGREIRVLSLRGTDKDFFGHHSISFTCELPASGMYDVSIDVVKGPELGKVQIFRDEAAAGNEVDLYNPIGEVSRGIIMGSLYFVEGPNQVMFKITGKNKNSEGLGFDLTNIIFDLVE